ncbi:MAG: nuclease [Acidobacteriota bacterium]|nr:nuclease [Acidobacteriota bacterium]
MIRLQRRALAYGVLSGMTLALPAAMFAQQRVGTVRVEDATIAGPLQVSGGEAVLLGSATITAKDHTAEVKLARTGSVRVCATSSLHLTAGKGAPATAPLLLALDRGAMEVRLPASPSDVVMTPDLRFSPAAAGPLQLMLRVTRSGDTCVENAGAGAPALNVSDQFGEASYVLRPGQHVLFEHGSLREVVDHESSPCGCPVEPVVSVADSGVSSATPAAPGSPVAAAQAAAQHPFPAAVSQGLAPTPAVPQAPAGLAHVEVSTTLSYGAGSVTVAGAAAPATASSASGSVAESSKAGSSSAAPPSANNDRAQLPPAPAATSSGLGSRIGRFFRRLFGRK